jgi:hypothetical protein
MEGRNDQCAVSEAGLRVLNELVEACKSYRVRHVRRGVYLVCIGSAECGGEYRLKWMKEPHPLYGEWDKQAALGLAKFWIALTGDMEVEIEEVKP